MKRFIFIIKIFSICMVIIQGADFDVSAQSITNKDILVVDGYDLPNDKNIIKTIIPNKVDNPSCLSDFAKAFKMPAYLPRYSDVIMRSLKIRPISASDNQNTFDALDMFHVTRLEWTYLSKDEDFEKVKKIIKSGVQFGASIEAHPLASDTSLSALTVDGKSLVLKHQRQFRNIPSVGCMNRSTYFNQQLNEYKKYIDKNIFLFQRDDPRQNSTAYEIGGCFCAYCIEHFKDWLTKNVSKDELEKTGISNVETFNYKNYLINIKAPVGDDFKSWNGGKIKEWFIKSNALVDVEYHKRLSAELDKYAGKHIPISCNNTSFQQWLPAHKVFDWGYSEMIMSTAKPERIYERSYAARSVGKIQVYSSPKTIGNEIIKEDLREKVIRKSCATAYATGGIMSVPWDVYEQTPKGGDRYFGLPEQYSDLYGFVRGIAKYLDSYEEVCAKGDNIAEQLLNGEMLIGKLPNNVYAFVRAIPNNPNAPIVIHIVNWNDSPVDFNLSINKKLLFGGRDVVLKQLTPISYSKKMHYAAEQKAQKMRKGAVYFTADQSKAFEKLIMTNKLSYEEGSGNLSVSFEKHGLWSVIVISKK